MLSRREILEELRRFGFNEFSFLKKSTREFERYVFENYGLVPEELSEISSSSGIEGIHGSPPGDSHDPGIEKKIG